jgi:hypothetical protein
MIDSKECARIARGLPILERADPQMTREFQQSAFLTLIPKGRVCL